MNRALLSLLAVVVPAVVLPAFQPQPQAQDEPFAEEERVTALDLLVGLRPIAKPPPSDLSPRRFAVRVDGSPLPIVSVATADRRSPPGLSGEPWQFVVYFDAGLLSRESLRAAAEALAQRAGRLSQLGQVEVVVADSRGQTRLTSGEAPELLEEALSGLALRGEAENRLVQLRTELMESLDGEPRPAEGAALLEAAIAQEITLVQQDLDELLEWTLEQPRTQARRALILVSDGFDLEPGAFYRPLLVPPEIDLVGEAPGLAPAVEEAARTLAAYGWLVVAIPGLESEEPEWHARRRLESWLDGNRRPKKARSYLALGLSLLQEGKPQQAEDAFRQALHHYYGDPRFADERAEAQIHLAQALKLQGRTGEAQEAFRQAVRLDPGQARDHPGAAAALNSPGAPLEEISRATAGHLARSRTELDEALLALGHRIRLTYQVTGLPDGRLHSLEVLVDGGRGEVIAPAWMRSGTPETVAALRVRRLLGDEPQAGDLVLSAACRQEPGRAGRMALSADRRDFAPERRDPRLRLSLGRGAPDLPARISHRPLGAEELEALRTGLLRLELELEGQETWVAAVLEDLDSGRWGGASCWLE